MGTKGTIIIQESEGRMPQELCQQLLEEGYRIVYEEDRRAGSQIEIGTACILEVDNHCNQKRQEKDQSDT